MRNRARIGLLALVAVPASILFWAVILSLPFAQDFTGDLRTRVAFDADGRMTIDGVGVGTPSPDPDRIGTLARMQVQFGDFETVFRVTGEVRDGRVHFVALGYEGLPLGLLRTALRWRQVLREHGAECGLDRCELRVRGPDGQEQVTRMGVRWAWYGPQMVAVGVVGPGG